MKYKILGIIVCVLALLISIMVPAFVLDDNKRTHQHEVDNVSYSVKEDNYNAQHGLTTNLPIVIIDTYGEEIPGAPIKNESGADTGKYTLSKSGEDNIVGSVKVVDHDDKVNNVNDSSTVESKMKIHIRGNSSRSFDKKSYQLKLIKEDGTSNKQQMMGMSEHDEWALYGPHLDKTLIRNYMWYNIAGEMMEYAPNVRFCEVVLNGQYKGLYVMTETITSGKNGRLNISYNKQNLVMSGYVLKLDRGNDNQEQIVNTFSKYAMRTKMNLEVVYPGSSKLTSSLMSNIISDFSRFEKALYSYDYDDEKYGYRKYIDVDSFVDYFILNEFTCNYDAGWLSTYIYKDTSGLYKTCVWDFNSSCDNYIYSQTEPMRFQLQDSLWYYMLVKDDYFVNKVIRRYKELRKTFLSDNYLQAYIDNVTNYLGDAIERNYSIWGYTFGKENGLLLPQERNFTDYEESINQLKTFIKERGNWMDKNIDTLKQYCATSKIKKFNKDVD